MAPDETAAVRVTAVPCSTEVTDVPPEEIVRIVAVAAALAEAYGGSTKENVASRNEMNNFNSILRFTDNLFFC